VSDSHNKTCSLWLNMFSLREDFNRQHDAPLLHGSEGGLLSILRVRKVSTARESGFHGPSMSTRWGSTRLFSGAISTSSWIRPAQKYSGLRGGT